MSGPVPGLLAESNGRAVRLAVRVQPNARRRGVAGSWNGLLRLAVAVPPEDGRANAAVAELLAELFELRPSAVELVQGHSARTKVFRLALAATAARTRLAELLAYSG